MMRCRAIFVTVLLALSAPACTIAPQTGDTTTVHSDMGGGLGERIREVARMNRNGEAVRIAGRCVSSCTMYLGVERACVEPDATLEFHAPNTIYGAYPYFSITVPIDEAGRRLWAAQWAQHLPAGAIRQRFLDDWSHRKHDTAVKTGAELHDMDPEGVPLCR